MRIQLMQGYLRPPGAREAYLRTSIRSIWIDGWRRRRGARLYVVPDPPDAAAGPLGLDDGGGRPSSS